VTKKTLLPLTIERTLKPAAAGLILAWASQASAFKITSAITGWWEQPNEQNHGLIVSTSQLPDGSQRSDIGGVARGTINAQPDDDDDNADELFLDFSVRGESIEILEDDTVIFSGTFPSA